jgi:hypothetical protein
MHSDDSEEEEGEGEGFLVRDAPFLCSATNPFPVLAHDFLYILWT